MTYYYMHGIPTLTFWKSAIILFLIWSYLVFEPVEVYQKATRRLPENFICRETMPEFAILDINVAVYILVWTR
jgi:hypothetical protein